MTYLRALPLILISGLLLASCNVRPVYGPSGGYGIDEVSAELASIAVQTAKGRVSQEFRNRLVFRFNHGNSTSEKKYLLSYTIAQSDDAIAIEEFSGAPSSYRLTLTLRYRLMDQQADTPVTSGTVRASASYDRSTQSFANLRARRDAENRAANTAADEVTSKLSTFFASR